MRTLPPRLLLIISAAFAGVVMITLVLLSAAGAVDPIAAAQLAVSVLTLAAAAVIVAAVRRTDGKALRIDARTKREEAALTRAEHGLAQLAATLDGLTGRLEEAGLRQSRVVLAALGEDRMELTAQAERLSQLASAVSRVDATVRESAGDLEDLRKLRHDHEQLARTVLSAVRDLDERLDTLGGAVRDGQADLARSARHNYAQLEALIDLRALLQPRAPLPRLRGWAASPDVLRLLIERIAVDRAKIIVECGSGSSSIWLGYAVQQFGGGRVVALEHDERFAEASRDLVLAHGLQDVVEVRHAPLASWTPGGQAAGRTGEEPGTPQEGPTGPDGGETFPWYDTSALDDVTGIDLVFVDGPPGNTAPLARYPALPVLLPRCADEAWFVLDDTDRPAEREVADRWLREHPELTGAAYPAEKGAMVLRRNPR
ncbi:class I SAM-dependent methyltransferase [Sphaerisporangium perillae]|uniref:class I SAM-dependent methyltransferase n=1 Tax=Sphaerisporangium perillae TaxID=2935860 RepID=UPI00200FF2D0|nr:class I SAM-dependent methyltransferase [Sphaerisporangium perillae]